MCKIGLLTVLHFVTNLILAFTQMLEFRLTDIANSQIIDGNTFKS